MKNQAIIEMDMPLWEGIIDAYELEGVEPMIPHRDDEHHTRGPGKDGWYV